MPSFDIVSKLDLAEVDNALNQARKEIDQRYDFKGSGTTLTKDDKGITLKTASDMQLEAAWEVLAQKLAKRGVSLKGISRGEIEQAGGGALKQLCTLQQGIPIEKAKEIVKAIKDSKIKVQGAIQGDLVRVSGKNRDDLQSAMALVRAQADTLDLALQFTNFRE